MIAVALHLITIHNNFFAPSIFGRCFFLLSLFIISISRFVIAIAIARIYTIFNSTALLSNKIPIKCKNNYAYESFMWRKVVFDFHCFFDPLCVRVAFTPNLKR